MCINTSIYSYNLYLFNILGNIHQTILSYFHFSFLFLGLCGRGDEGRGAVASISYVGWGFRGQWQFLSEVEERCRWYHGEDSILKFFWEKVKQGILFWRRKREGAKREGENQEGGNLEWKGILHSHSSFQCTKHTLIE